MLYLILFATHWTFVLLVVLIVESKLFLVDSITFRVNPLFTEIALDKALSDLLWKGNVAHIAEISSLL